MARPFWLRNKPGKPEHVAQVQFITWARYYLPEPLRTLLFAIPNGGSRHVAEAINLKAEGVTPGVPDLLFSWHRLGYHALYIEMKRPAGGTISHNQHDMINALRGAGYAVAVCAGTDEAKTALEWYMISDGTNIPAMFSKNSKPRGEKPKK